MIWLFLFVAFPILFYEIKKYKTFISPTILTIFSYTVAVVLAIIGKYVFGYIPVSNKMYMVLTLAIYVTWIPSLFFSCHSRQIIVFEKQQTAYSVNIITIILLLLICLLFLDKLKYGSVGSELFETNYSHGIFAHLLILYSVIATYILCFIKKKLIDYVFIVTALFFVFLSGVKYHIIFIFLVYILKQLIVVSKNKVLHIGFICFILVFFIFSLNYFVGFMLRNGSVDENAFINFAFNHFLKYVSGGIIGFSTIMDGAIRDSGGFVAIDMSGMQTTNVYSLIGQYILNYGYLGGFLILFLHSSSAYFFFYKSMTEKNLFYRKSYFMFYAFFFGVPFFLSFFAPYHGLLRVWEWGFWSLLISIIQNYKSWNYFFKS